MLSVRADHGGGPRHLYQLIKNLNHQFEIFTACPHEEPYWDLFKEVLDESHMEIIPHRRFRFSKLNDLVTYVRSNNIQLIHSHGKGAGLYGRLLSLKTGVISVHTFHGIHIDNYNLLQKWLYLKLEKWLCSHSKACIAVSHSEYQRILELKIVSKQKLFTILNGVFVAKKKDVLKLQKRVICISRENYQKNPNLIIQIAKLLPDFEFRLIGIESSEYWNNKLEGVNNVTMMGLLSENKIIQQMEWASICLSTSRWEGLPLALLESMSQQVAIVATQVPGNRDLVEEDGWMFESNNPEAGAEAIIDCLSNYQIYERKVRSAYSKLTQTYNETLMSKMTADLYLKLLEKDHISNN